MIEYSIRICVWGEKPKKLKKNKKAKKQRTNNVSFE